MPVFEEKGKIINTVCSNSVSSKLTMFAVICFSTCMDRCLRYF